MFSEVAFKAANIYHPRMFCQTPSAKNLTPVIGLKKEWINQQLKTEAKYFLLHHLMRFISQNNSRVQIRCEIVKISLYLVENNKYFK